MSRDRQGNRVTGATTSAITYLDGEQGILRYRGYPIEVLAERCDFVEISYLLIYGELPNHKQLEAFRSQGIGSEGATAKWMQAFSKIWLRQRIIRVDFTARRNQGRARESGRASFIEQSATFQVGLVRL